MTIIQLVERSANSREPVDIVAIHGILENGTQTWTDGSSGILWLKDLLPKRLPNIRVLLFSYKAETLTSPGEGTTDRILAHATSLIAELCADRQLDDAFDRPIVFVCHGLGGLLLKRALAYSSSRRHKNVEHLRSIYTSTYGILFLGTPHNGINKEILLLPQESQSPGPSQFVINLLKGSEMLNEINDQFAPLMKQFSIYNFWEMLETQHTSGKAYVVDQDSAAPPWDNVEKCGIMATHSTMVKFDSHTDHKYRPVFEAISRYVKNAHALIRSRWENDSRLIAKERQQEAEELLQPSLQFLQASESASQGYNQWCIVPRSPSTYFTGRQKHAREVQELLGPIEKHRNKKHNTVVVIYGLGGSGKTQFCLKYVEDNKHRYWGVFWVDASSEKNLESGFAAIGAQAGRGSTMTAGIYWLSRCTEPWLLVLDNADDEDMDISQYLPVGGNGHVLITTRNRSATEYATDGRKIRFRGLELQEAISFLLKSAYPDLRLDIPPATPRKWQLAKGIAIELGLLPLALAHAGATIRRNIYTLDKYLHYYLGHRKTTMSYPRVKSADEANIIATWEIPFQKIAKRRTLEHRDAVDLMHIFAFMHFETIPESIFRRSWIDLSDTEILPKQRPDILQTVWNEEAQSRFRRAIGVLGDHSIIDYEESTASCSMHPVIHTWARDRLTEAEQKHWLRCAMAILAECISPNLEASGRQFRASLLPHINFCLQSLKSQYPSLPETLENAAMFERFAWVYTEQCSWKTARLWHERVVKIRRKQLGRRHPQTIFAQRNLGHTLWNLFEIKPAIDVQLQVLKTLWWHRHSLKEWATWPLWKPIHTPYCLALDDLTLTLWLAGVRDKSKMTGERAVDGLTRRLGPYDPRTLNAMFNLARTYLHIGEHEKSRKLLLHVLRLQKRFFGMKHPDTLMTRNELGMNLCASKRHLPAAQSLIENVLQARKEVLGDEHAYTLWSINDLSKVYTERGYLDRALYMLEDVLVTAKRTLGEDHVGTSMTLANLAKTYFLAQKWKEAEETIRPLLARVPKQHPDWVHNMYGYAQIKFTLGDIKEAEQLCIETLDTISQTKSLAIDNPRTLAIADLLLTIYRQQGRNDDIASIKAKFPGTDKTRNEDRYDPYAIRRGSDAPPKMLSALSSSAVRPKRNSDAGQKPVHKSEHRESSPLRPGLKLVGRRTF